MIDLEKTSDYSRLHFSVFRVCFGLYLLWHFIALLPHGVELFSADGVMGGDVNPFYGKWWNPLFYENSASLITPWLGAAALASVGIMLGWWRRACALFLAVTWSCLFTANPLIANPSLGYIGMLLLLCAVIPVGEGFGLGKKSDDWKMPAMACVTAWVLLAAGYTFSGVLKLGSPSWIDGSALLHLLENPLARPGIARDIMLFLPDGILRVMTWGVLALEVLFLPLVLLKRVRPWVWLAMLMMHIGIMFTVDFTDLSMGMIMVHLFTFQRSWIPSRAPREGGNHVLFVDGECSFCQHSARAVMAIDKDRVMHFSSLQGNAASALPDDWRVTKEGDKSTGAVALLEQQEDEEDKLWRGADAILRVLYLLGGGLSVLWLLHWIPRFLKDPVYDFISRHRLKIVSKECSLPTPEQRQRFIP